MAEGYDYEIPESITSRIDLRFAEKLLMKLKEKFDGSSILDTFMFSTSSYGWSDAFNEACTESGREYLLSYEKALTWWQYDIFASDLTAQCINMVIDADLEIAKRIKGVCSDRMPDPERL